MTFILEMLDSPDISSLERHKRFEEYRKYLEANRQAIPTAAYKFATSDWHYDFGDSRCPHDAWLENLTMQVTASGARHEVRPLDIHMTLLGARHDGYIHLHYKTVWDFDLKHPFDWYCDELSLAGKGSLGRIVHTIRGSASTDWTILCEELSYEWEPVPEAGVT